MATDLAGSVMSFRYGSGPTTIKIIRGTYDAESGHNRAVPTESSGHPRTIITSKGGIIQIEGYFSKDSTIVALHDSPTVANLRISTDSTDVSSPYVIHFNDGPSSAPGGQALNFKWTGESSLEGMQTFTCDFHSQYGSVVNTTA